MRERRYVKFKLDIYDDTKTKIIDQKPERDFIHYFFARSIILAGKADCGGDLYMAKNIPYTIETLAIEFNRDAALVKLALELLIELKMIEVTEDNIYRVKSFAKHQNIKLKEEAKTNHREEASVSESNNQGGSLKITTNRENEEKIREDVKSIDVSDAIMEEKNINNNHDKLAVLEIKDNNKSNKSNKKKKSNLVTELSVDEIEDDRPLLFFYEGDMPPLEEGERIVWG